MRSQPQTKQAAEELKPLHHQPVYETVTDPKSEPYKDKRGNESTRTGRGAAARRLARPVSVTPMSAGASPPRARETYRPAHRPKHNSVPQKQRKATPAGRPGEGAPARGRQTAGENAGQESQVQGRTGHGPGGRGPAVHREDTAAASIQATNSRGSSL